MLVVAIVILFQSVWLEKSRAADRTLCYLPLPANAAESRATGFPTSEEQAQIGSPLSDPASMRQSGVTPDQAVGDSGVWSRYMQLWRSHHDDPADATLRRLLSLPVDDEVLVAARPGRTSPRSLGWRAGTFRVWQTPHFEILSRASDDESRKLARHVERLYWVWTQMFFPLWSSRDQAALFLEDWDPNSISLSRHLDTTQRLARLAPRQRHRIVFLPNAQMYRTTISTPGVSAGTSSNIVSSAGFYSDSLQTSFFHAEGIASSVAHEVCHQLFEEATDRRKLGRSFVGSSVTESEAFWLVEGIAGHFESIRFAGPLATIGGWDSSRLQYARYQTRVAQTPVSSTDDLAGNAPTIQQRDDLPLWYSQAITRTHFAMDASDAGSPGQAVFPMRKRILAQLADLYHIRLAEPFQQDAAAVLDRDAIERFLAVDTERVIQHPITSQASELCLATCDINDAGWSSLPSLPNLQWFDASRTRIGEAQVRRLIVNPQRLDQLSLEATPVTSGIADVLSQCGQLRELDLSWTMMDDPVVNALARLANLETLWLTGTKVSDSAIDSLIGLPRLKTVDLQRTKVSDAGLNRLRMSKPAIEINPLVLP